MRKIIDNILLFLIVVFIVFAAILVLWIIPASFEAKSYNRVTGNHVSTWDAMWLDLRVQGTPK